MLGLKLIHDNKIGGWCDRIILLPRSYYDDQWTLNDTNLKSACRNNINYTLPWRHTSVMVSQITGTSTVWRDELEYVFKSRESIWAYLSFSHFPDCPDRTKRILQKKWIYHTHEFFRKYLAVTTVCLMWLTFISNFTDIINLQLGNFVLTKSKSEHQLKCLHQKLYKVMIAVISVLNDWIFW